MLQTVIETPSYLVSAKDAGISEEERAAIVNAIANDPAAGDLIPGAGGCRKVRFAGRGKGKSGGYRLITFYGGSEIPVFLLTIFSKGERADLTQKERNQLGDMAKGLMTSLGQKVDKLRR